MAQYIYEDARVEKKTSLLAQTFTWVLIGLLLTSGVGIALAFLVNSLLNTGDSAGLTAYITALSISGLVQLVMVFYIQFSVIRKGPMEKNITVPYLIYAANMGILISALLVFLSFEVMALALAITVIIFAMMTIYARQTKRNLNGLALIGSGIILGALAIMLVNIFIGSSQIDWIISFVLLGAIMLVTMFDIWKLTKISETGVESKNLALFFAFNIYIDFIYILIRIAYFIGISRND